METLAALESILRTAFVALVVLMILLMIAAALVEHPPRHGGFIVRRARDGFDDRGVNVLIARMNRRAVEEAREREAARRLDAGT